MSSTRTQTPAQRANSRRVAFATVIGTTVEWYDFFIYATAAGLVFARAVLQARRRRRSACCSPSPTVGISFLFRPLGAFLAGHFGDKIGRRAMLVITLILMGAATTLIGVLPTYETVGRRGPDPAAVPAHPAGHLRRRRMGRRRADGRRARAPKNRAAVFGAFPQLGVPLGLLLASGVMALMTGVIAPGEQFLAWGWRMPFLLSIVLIVVGYLVRRAVDESPGLRGDRRQEAADQGSRSSSCSASTGCLSSWPRSSSPATTRRAT